MNQLIYAQVLAHSLTRTLSHVDNFNTLSKDQNKMHLTKPRIETQEKSKANDTNEVNGSGKRVGNHLACKGCCVKRTQERLNYKKESDPFLFIIFYCSFFLFNERRSLCDIFVYGLHWNIQECHVDQRQMSVEAILCVVCGVKESIP